MADDDGGTSGSLPQMLGPYQVHERIAVGGMSEVYLAAVSRAAGADRTVVVKRMLPRVAADGAMRQMFSDEGRFGAQIHHPNVVEVIDHSDGDGDSGQPFIALEYVHGVDLWRLGRWLTRSGSRLPSSLAVFVAREMLAGLHAVHEACDDTGQRMSVVHRDVSPSNVLLSVHGDVKLGDLGIARAMARERYPAGGTDARTKGKLGYLSPEQVRGREPDRRADVFAAAVVIAELLMGRPLFSGGSELAVLLAIRDSNIHPFVEFSTTLPPGLGDAVVSALSATPDERPATAEILRNDLRAFDTESRADSRSALAKHVLGAMGEAAAASPQGATPTRTVSDAAGGAQLWFEERTTPPREGTPLSEAVSYRITTGDGTRLGPWPFSRVVEAVSTGRLGPFDRVTAGELKEQLLSSLPDLARHIPGSTATTQQSGQGMVRSGAVVPLESGGIISALAHGAADRFTGLLMCEKADVRKEVYLKEGVPAFVTSNQSGELLGEHLVTKGVISRGELDMALAVMPRFEGRLGDTLAGLGLVDPVLLFRHIGEQVREKLLELFLWPEGGCTHYLGVHPPESSFPLELDPWEIIDEGLAWRVTKGIEDAPLRAASERKAATVEGPTTISLRRALPLQIGSMMDELKEPRVPALLWSSEEDYERRTRKQRDFLLLLHMRVVRWVG